MSSINQLLRENNPNHEILVIAGKLADKENISAYIVGGYIRDILLGKKSNDIDIMVEGDGIAFAAMLSKKLMMLQSGQKCKKIQNLKMR